MRNYLEFEDGNGQVIFSGLNTLKNLDRFKPLLNEVRNIVQNMLHEGTIDGGDVGLIEEYAEDFYSAWSASNTELIQCVGINAVLEFLQLFRSVHFIAWSSESMTFLEKLECPIELQLFRGASSQSSLSGADGLSWTLDKGIAQYYASRHSDGSVYAGTAMFADVLALFSEEMEVIVAPGKVVVKKNELLKPAE